MCVKKKYTKIPPPPTNLMEILNENEGLLLERISITFYPVIKHLGYNLYYGIPRRKELAALRDYTVRGQSNGFRLPNY